MQWLFWVIVNKIKKGSGINFWCTFTTSFFNTNAPYIILYQLTKFQSHIFSTGYQTKCVIEFLFTQLMMS